MDLTNMKFKFDQFQLDIVEEIGKVVEEEVAETLASELRCLNDELESAISRLEDIASDAEDLSNSAGSVRRALIDLTAPWS